MDEWLLLTALRAVWAWRRHPDLGGYGPGWCDETYLRRLRAWGYTADEIGVLATAGAAGNTVEGYRRFGIVDADTIAACQALGLPWHDAGHFFEAGITDPEHMRLLQPIVSGFDYRSFRDAGVADIDEMLRWLGVGIGGAAAAAWLAAGVEWESAALLAAVGVEPDEVPVEVRSRGIAAFDVGRLLAEAAPRVPPVVVEPTPDHERVRAWSGRPRPPQPFTDAHDAHCAALQYIVQHNADERERDAAIELLLWVDGGWDQEERAECARLRIDAWTAWQFASCDVREPRVIASLLRAGIDGATALRWGERGVTGVEALQLVVAADPDDVLVDQLLPAARRRDPLASLPDDFELDVGALVAAQVELVTHRLLDDLAS